MSKIGIIIIQWHLNTLSLKAQTIIKKHGVDFNKAQALWENQLCWLVIGKIKGKHPSVEITYRGKNVRIISVRRSHFVES